MQKNELIKTRVLIIDGLNFIYRGCVKFSKEEPNKPGALIYNFFRNLKALLEEFHPQRCFFILEGIPYFRYALYEKYKANRIKLAATEERELLKKEREIIFSLMQFLPLTTIKAEKYEADDVIFTLSENLRDENVCIISSDSDLIQIIQKFPSVKLYNATKKAYVIAPKYVSLVKKALAGDASDNVPSIISEKEAEYLASSPAAFAKFLANEECRAQFNLNKSLIELRNVPHEELLIQQHKAEFSRLKEEFLKLKLGTLCKEPYWNNFVKAFD